MCRMRMIILIVMVLMRHPAQRVAVHFLSWLAIHMNLICVMSCQVYVLGDRTLSFACSVQNPVPNAYTLAIAGRQPFIVIHTALLELLTPRELQVYHYVVESME